MAEILLEAASSSMNSEATALNGPAPGYPAGQKENMSREAIMARRHQRVFARTIRFAIEGPPNSQNGRRFW